MFSKIIEKLEELGERMNETAESIINKLINLLKKK